MGTVKQTLKKKIELIFSYTAVPFQCWPRRLWQNTGQSRAEVAVWASWCRKRAKSWMQHILSALLARMVKSWTRQIQAIVHLRAPKSMEALLNVVI